MNISVVIILNNKLNAYREELYQRQQEEQYKQLDLYTHEVEKFYTTVRGFKHDYKGMIVALRDSVQAGDIDNIRYLYQDILESANIQLSEGENIDDLSYISNPALKSLLYQKLTQARQDGIMIHLDIKTDIPTENISLLDLVRILSVLVDNAVEAAIEATSPEIFFGIVRTDMHHIIHIKNAIKEQRIPINRIYQRGYSTKGSGRGEGLWQIREIIECSPHLSNETEISDGFFTQVVYIGV